MGKSQNQNPFNLLQIIKRVWRFPQAILKSYLFQARTKKMRRATENSWPDGVQTPYKIKQFAHAQIATQTGTTIFTNSFLGNRLRKKYGEKNYVSHTNTNQYFARTTTTLRLADFPAIPEIRNMAKDANSFAVIAIFYFEWRELMPWLTHYRNQGANHFFLYFNSNVIPKKLEKIVSNASDITLIIWPFLYYTSTWKFNSGNPFHSAQSIALQHALELIKTRTNFRYVLTCDLDEYIIGEQTISECLTTFPKELSFANFWSMNYHGFIQGGLPLIAQNVQWQPWHRVKSIVDTKQIERLDIHRIWDENNLDQRFMMLHFKDIPKSGWIDPSRINVDESLENIPLPDHPNYRVREIWAKYILSTKKLQ